MGRGGPRSALIPAGCNPSRWRFWVAVSEHADRLRPQSVHSHRVDAHRGGALHVKARAVSPNDARGLSTEADWLEIETSVRPAGLTDADWLAFWSSNIRPRIGDTWGDYVSLYRPACELPRRSNASCATCLARSTRTNRAFALPPRWAASCAVRPTTCRRRMLPSDSSPRKPTARSNWAVPRRPMRTGSFWCRASPRHVPLRGGRHAIQRLRHEPRRRRR